MKTILLTIALLVGTAAQAEILNSQYDARHLAMLEKASLKACGVTSGTFVQIYSSVVKHKVDQGIVDAYYTTQLTLNNTYTVTAQTLIADGYDQAAQDWGIYSVESITCQ
ncbi:hypothetical protein CIK05_12210 [Bdellovibrio sp. qaytius]|nr:hypothetical protein CIK05_12210 [Bdellovibrio sp. qaytius]